MEAYISYYLHLDPDVMSEEEIIKNFERVKYVLTTTGQMKFTN